MRKLLNPIPKPLRNLRVVQEEEVKTKTKRRVRQVEKQEEGIKNFFPSDAKLPENERRFWFYAKRDFRGGRYETFKNSDSAILGYELLGKLVNLGLFFVDGCGLRKSKLVDLKKSLAEEKTSKEKKQDTVDKQSNKVDLTLWRYIMKRANERDIAIPDGEELSESEIEELVGIAESLLDYDKMKQLVAYSIIRAYRTHCNLGEMAEYTKAISLLDEYIKTLNHDSNGD